MKKFLKPTIITILLITAVIFFLLSKNSGLSDIQKETIDLLGNPDQFVITYIPRGDEDETEMVRSEVWYYKEVGKSVSFLSGELITADTYSSQENLSTDLFPWEFDVLMSIKDITEALNTEAVLKISNLPVFDGDNVETYISDKALFVIENGYLTYFQTIGLSNDDLSGEEVSVPTNTPTPGVKQIKNNIFNFEMEIPSGWVLNENDIILTNIDLQNLNYEETQIPDDAIKCDFVGKVYDLSSSLEKTVYEKDDLKLNRLIVTEEEDDTPGYGDGIIYEIISPSKDDLWLTCFILSEKAISDLENSLQTFRYVE